MRQIGHFFGAMPPWTASSKLPGGEFAPEEFDAQLSETMRRWPFLSATHARRLHAGLWPSRRKISRRCEKHGRSWVRRFAGDLTAAEVRYMVENEWAQNADDVLWRRSKIGLQATAEDCATLDRFIASHERKGGRDRASGGPGGGSSFAGRSHRYRPRHDVDARHRVRRGACSRSPPRRRSCVRSIRRRAKSSMTPRKSGRRWSPPCGRSWPKHGITAKDVAGIGITNQRETTRHLGPRKPASRSTTRSCGRTGARPNIASRLRRTGHEAGNRRQDRTAARSLFFRQQDRLAARPCRRRPRGGRSGQARLRHDRLVSCCGG